MQNRSVTNILVTFLVLAVTLAAQAQTYKLSTLYSFKKNGKDPVDPISLILSGDGNLYGTSDGGGIRNLGTVFKLTRNGALTVLHNFNTVPPGQGPNGIARDNASGNLYGTTGTTVFKLVPGKNGTYTFSTIYNNSNAQLLGSLVDSKGNFYGTDQTCTSFLSPCVFEVPKGGKWTDIWDLCEGCGEPFNLFGNIIIDRSGDLYVSAAFTGLGGSGWVQQIGGNFNEFGPAFTFPISLRQDAAGDIFGLAQGDFQDDGTNDTVFKRDTKGVVSIIYTFMNDHSVGGSFSVDKSGNVFGTAGGRFFGTSGTVYKITPTGVFGNIATVGNSLHPGVVIDSAGNLYGLTSDGGASGLGSVYKLTLTK